MVAGWSTSLQVDSHSQMLMTVHQKVPGHGGMFFILGHEIFVASFRDLVCPVHLVHLLKGFFIYKQNPKGSFR